MSAKSSESQELNMIEIQISLLESMSEAEREEKQKFFCDSAYGLRQSLQEIRDNVDQDRKGWWEPKHFYKFDSLSSRLVELEKEDLCGFIFKSRSPSSGMERVKVYNEKGGMAGRAPGMFAKAFMQHFPLLPCEDEGRLHDADLRENFAERIFMLSRYREEVGESPKAGALVKFHAQNKYLLMAHSEKHCRAMGKLVAGSAKTKSVFAEYETMLLEAMKLKATVAKHVNVLQHIMGYFKKHLSPDEKQELVETIEDYRKEYVPLIVPTTLLNHYERKYQDEYLKTQYYLHPHPTELKLRNHA